MQKIKKEIISKLPRDIGDRFLNISFLNLQEIRFRSARPVMLYYSHQKEKLKNSDGTDYILTCQDIERVVANFCRHSVYAYTNDIRDGFITLSGGHRVGISGRAVMNESGYSNMCEFSSVNIRIAKEYPESAGKCIDELFDGERIYNTIIIAPPGAGKTTLLRDITRRLAQKFKVSLIDERSEIASVRCGVPQFDVGTECDVLSGFLKKDGIILALRSLSPDVIICDEIGTKEDVKSIESILKGGCKIITSMHGYSIEEARKNKKELLSFFEKVILLKKQNGTPEVIACQNLWE